jgi:hypothetical protein
MKTPFSGQKKIKDVVYTLLEPTLKQQGWLLSKLMLHWEKIVGKELKQHLWPVRFAPNPKQKTTGILWLKATPSGTQYLLYNKGMLIEKINLHIGESAVLDLKTKLWHNTSFSNTHVFRHSPAMPIHIPSILEDIQDPDLKEALENLGRSISL